LAVRIRLARVGATKRPSYRVVAIDRQRSRDGRALEILGFYDPLTDPATVRLDDERIRAWIDRGALPSDTVVKLMRQASAVSSDGTPDATTAKRGKATPRPRTAARKTPAKAAAKTSSEAPAE
jgi:small subunit ribosomal protein S16